MLGMDDLQPVAPSEKPKPNAPTAKERVWQVIGSTKIAVSKHTGKIWKSRRDVAAKKREEAKLGEAWKEAIRYYKNDQVADVGRDKFSKNSARGLSGAIVLEFSETENIVFANTNSAVSAVYAKNPEVDITSKNDQLLDICNMTKTLVNALFDKLETPGINLKPKVRRACVNAFLCNLGWAEVGWTFKSDSTEQAVIELQQLAEDLGNAKSAQEIEDIEGKLQALDDQVAMLSPAGPFVKWRPVASVLRDPLSVEEDLSDANWVMYSEFLSTKFLKAKYAREGTNESIYEPTHLLPVGGKTRDGVEDIEYDVNNFSPFNNAKGYEELGYPDQETYNECQLTRVWYVWDRTTRRVYLYHDKDWNWPIWVWEDKYRFTTFFPLIPLYFYISPEGGESKGEVSYYLDQQDAINFCNSMVHLTRHWTGTKIGYDTNTLTHQKATEVLLGKGREVIGFNVPEGRSLNDIVPQALMHPASKFTNLFDKGAIYQAIDRISIVSDVQRGAQFKTNTTNDAISKYDAVTQTKYDTVVDAVEDFVGKIGYHVAQLCWRFMDTQTVVNIIGQEGAQWQNLPDEQINMMSCRVAGGSTQKPNTKNRRQEALELGQVIGQFAKAVPPAALVILRMFSRVFDDMEITDDEWQMITQAMQSSMMPPGVVGGTTVPTPPEVQGLPPEAQQAYNAMVTQGVDPQTALQKIMSAIQVSGNG